MITNQGVFNLSGKSLKRKILIHLLAGITISKTCEEFVLHGKQKQKHLQYL